jgi:holin-like protein
MAIILGLLAAGEALSALLELPVPGSVLGMALMACLLALGLIRLSWVEDAASFLTENLAFFFVPAGVGLMVHFELLSREWPLILGLTAATTCLVVAVVGLFHRALAGGRKGTPGGSGSG